MFLRAKSRLKEGKVHRYWSIVENRRTQGNRIVQRQVLYLGEINDNQQAAWCKTIEVLQEGQAQPQAVGIFPEDRIAPVLGCEIVSIKLRELQLHRPRQWGACWLACQLWDQLRLDEFWSDKLPASRQGTRWLNVFKTLVCYRLIDPGSEWRLHRHWYEQRAMGDLLGEDFGLVQIDKLYRCSDRANALKFLGKQHLTAEVIIPGGLQALLLETEVGRLLLKQIHAQVTDGRHDGGCVALADTAVVFSKHHIQPPVQTVFHAPMPPHCIGKLLGVRGNGVDEIASFDAPGFAHPAFPFHQADTA